MKKNIWLIIGGALLLVTVLILVIQSTLLILVVREYVTSAPQPSALVPTPELTSELPTIPPLGVIRQQLELFDQRTWKVDEQVQQMTPQECPGPRGGSGECSFFRTGMGTLTVIKDYVPFVDDYEYDLDDDGRAEAFKWDFMRDGQFDVIEYDVDEDGVFDYSAADQNGDGRFDDEELFINASGSRLPLWEPLVPGALPYPSHPITPY